MMEYREFGVLQSNPKHLAMCIHPYIVNEIIIILVTHFFL